MTLSEIEALPQDVLIPKDVAAYLKCDPYYINLMAKRDPAGLGFPTIMIGSRVKIPKAGFVNFCKGQENDNSKKIRADLRQKAAHGG